MSLFSKMDKTIVFIDAGFLSKLSKHFGKGRYLKYDVVKFAQVLSNEQDLECKQIFYYTAPPFQGTPPTQNEKKRKENYDKFIRKLNKRNVIIREGRCQRLKIDGRFEYRQKGVDSLAVMDLINSTLEFPEINKLILIASDSDFVPVIKNLRKKGKKIILYTYYEKGRSANFSTSNHLIKSVSRYVQLSLNHFLTAKLEK